MLFHFIVGFLLGLLLTSFEKIGCQPGDGKKAPSRLTLSTLFQFVRSRAKWKRRGSCWHPFMRRCFWEGLVQTAPCACWQGTEVAGLEVCIGYIYLYISCCARAGETLREQCWLESLVQTMPCIGRQDAEIASIEISMGYIACVAHVWKTLREQCWLESVVQTIPCTGWQGAEVTGRIGRQDTQACFILRLHV